MVRVEYSNDSIVTLLLDRSDKTTNMVDEPFLTALEKAMAAAVARERVKGVIITSAKDEFVVGADLTLFEKFKSIEDVRQVVGQMQRVFRAIERAPVPVVAAINGTALGGGYELALACHHRVALDSPKSLIGLPEVQLGLLPGAGGTQRLPRLIGYQKAVPLLTQGTKLKPVEALSQGLVDSLAKTPEELIQLAKTFILYSPKNVQPWDEAKFKLPEGDLLTSKGYQFFAAANAMVLEKTQGNYPAPRAILSSVYEGLQLPIDQALDIEMKYFCELAISPQAKSMIRTLFFHINACNKGAARPSSVPKTQIKKVSVLGAGMMGAGIAHVSARSGMQVTLKDVNFQAVDKGRNHVKALTDKDISRGRLTPEKQLEILARIHPTVDPQDLKGSQLVIEAVIESREIKAQVIKETEENTSQHSVFGSNTSTLPITGLAEHSSRPQNFIGIHFFSPVEKMQLVEIIVAKKTGDYALALAIDYVQALRKTPIVVNDGRGFYTSRVFTKYIEEGVVCLTDGITPALIENAGRQAGMPVGPLAVADEVSIDLIYHILKQTKKDLGDTSVNPELDKVSTHFVEELKRLGRKSGGGFYEYPKEGKKHLWSELTKIFHQRPDKNELDEVKTRLLYAQVLETLRCMEDGVLTSARDADVGSILGWGFPAYTGGTISFIDFVGIEKFYRETQRLQEKYGNRFKVPDLLTQRAKAGKGFYA